LLTHLQARNFRNLAPLSWEPGPGVHLLLGDNGAGKTSILEAIYILATTRSFRTRRLADCRRHEMERFDLAGEVEAAARVRLTVSWTEQQGRQRGVNGREVALAEHLAVLPVVAWTAEDGELLTGSPQPRRRFLDRGILGLKPPVIDIVARYRQALAQKRELLATGARDLPARLGAWNSVLAQAAAELIRLRQEYFERLTRHLGQVLQARGLPFPPIVLRYLPSPPEGRAGAAALEEALARAAAREQRQERPLLGPHRDDLEVLWGSRELQRVASAGERKALTMLLSVAHARVLEESGRTPLYLFDDADIELSDKTLAAIWKTLGPVEQLFATSNRPGVWEGIPIDARWQLEGGELGALKKS